jgi:D-proline reductase (dithiol) PrdB
MAPVNYVQGLDEMYQGMGFPPYKWSEFDSSPWTPFDKPLNQACVALLSSAGISREDQEPFDPWAINGLGFREIPIDTPFEKLRLNHNYFDNRDAMKDMNCVFPVHRLKDLEKEGHIGSVAPRAITLGMGRLYKRTALQNETVPKIVAALENQGADAVLLVAA